MHVGKLHINYKQLEYIESIEYSLYTYPFLFLFPLPHSNPFLLILYLDFFVLVDFLPPSLLNLLWLLRVIICRPRLLFGSRRILSKRWKHLINLLLICRWFLFYHVTHLLHILFPFYLFLLLDH
jgi:hypothetical protein